jgi:hypothetical protein
MKLSPKLRLGSASTNLMKVMNSRESGKVEEELLTVNLDRRSLMVRYATSTLRLTL